ncbi:MAG: SpoIVB peptidase [Clostridia bacterium]|nr:SpoIVB peptidase [Clostridia bacterium]
MGKKIYKGAVARSLCAALGLVLSSLLLFGVAGALLPSEIVLSEKEELPAYPCVALSDREWVGESDGLSLSTVSAKLFGIIQLKKIEVKEKIPLSLIVGGETFGVKILTDGVVITGFSSFQSGGESVCPAQAAGMKEKDVLLSINGVGVHSAAQVAALLEASGEKATLLCRRGSEKKEFTLTLAKCDGDGAYKAGLLVRDTSSGIGTVTFIDPETGFFGALGHGICDSATGELVPLSRGVVTDVKIHSIQKGAAGAPGELRGYLYGEKKGSVLRNTNTGVYGVLTSYAHKTPTPVATADEVKEGKAYICCAPDGKEVRQYEIEIKNINRQSETKSFTVCVTDEALLSQTGGIVQGLSGSPIIQDGKLVGAVTHVLVSNPTEGYGIFIENMLHTAEAQLQKAS